MSSTESPAKLAAQLRHDAENYSYRALNWSKQVAVEPSTLLAILDAADAMAEALRQCDHGGCDQRAHDWQSNCGKCSQCVARTALEKWEGKP